MGQPRGHLKDKYLGKRRMHWGLGGSGDSRQIILHGCCSETLSPCLGAGVRGCREEAFVAKPFRFVLREVMLALNAGQRKARVSGSH
jgi:hypothetical protein